MVRLPDQPGPNDPVNPLNVRETLHDTCRSSAVASGSPLRTRNPALGWNP